MNGPADIDTASLVRALAAAFVSFAPLCALVLWLATSTAPGRWVAERKWWRWGVLLVVVAVYGLGAQGELWAAYDLLGKSRPISVGVLILRRPPQAAPEDRVSGDTARS